MPQTRSEPIEAPEEKNPTSNFTKTKKNQNSSIQLFSGELNIHFNVTVLHSDNRYPDCVQDVARCGVENMTVQLELRSNLPTPSTTGLCQLLPLLSVLFEKPASFDSRRFSWFILVICTGLYKSRIFASCVETVKARFRVSPSTQTSKEGRKKWGESCFTKMSFSGRI